MYILKTKQTNLKHSGEYVRKGEREDRKKEERQGRDKREGG